MDEIGKLIVPEDDSYDRALADARRDVLESVKKGLGLEPATDFAPGKGYFQFMYDDVHIVVDVYEG